MADSPEESSWTFYIEGFVCDEISNKPCFSSSEFETTPSLLSDAASSSVAKKLTPTHFNSTSQHPFINLGFSSLHKQHSFKKQKTMILPSMDYDLEDTASSPVNSPKVSYMNEFMMSDDDKKEKAKMGILEVKRNSFGKAFGVERDSNKKKSSCGYD